MVVSYYVWVNLPSWEIYGVSCSLLGVDVLQGAGKVDQEQVNVAQAPCLILLLDHRKRMFLAVVVIPELCGDEDILALYKTLINGALDALACLFLILVIVRSVEESVTGFDGLLHLLVDQSEDEERLLC